MNNIFDPQFNGMAHSEMYRAEVIPDLFPHEPRMRVENWPLEDRIAYCGGEYVRGDA